jgi:hypothetical protein
MRRPKPELGCCATERERETERKQLLDIYVYTHSSRGVLPSVVCLSVMEEPHRGSLGQLGLSSYDTKIDIYWQNHPYAYLLHQIFLTSIPHTYRKCWTCQISQSLSWYYWRSCYVIIEKFFGRPVRVLPFFFTPCLLPSFFPSTSLSVVRLSFQGYSFSLLSLRRNFAHCLLPLFIMSSRRKIRRANGQEDYFVPVIRFPDKINRQTLLTVRLLYLEINSLSCTMCGMHDHVWRAKVFRNAVCGYRILSPIHPLT